MLILLVNFYLSTDLYTYILYILSNIYLSTDLYTYILYILGNSLFFWCSKKRVFLDTLNYIFRILQVMWSPWKPSQQSIEEFGQVWGNSMEDFFFLNFFLKTFKILMRFQCFFFNS